MKRYGRPLIAAAAFTLSVVGFRILFDPMKSDFIDMHAEIRDGLAFAAIIAGFVILFLLDRLKARNAKQNLQPPTDNLTN